jgi:hypothetical protein
MLQPCSPRGSHLCCLLFCCSLDAAAAAAFLQQLQKLRKPLMPLLQRRMPSWLFSEIERQRCKRQSTRVTSNSSRFCQRHQHIHSADVYLAFDQGDCVKVRNSLARALVHLTQPSGLKVDQLVTMHASTTHRYPDQSECKTYLKSNTAKALQHFSQLA